MARFIVRRCERRLAHSRASPRRLGCGCRRQARFLGLRRQLGMRACLVACGHVELAFGDSLRRLHIEHRGAGVIELRRYIEIGDYVLAFRHGRIGFR